MVTAVDIAYDICLPIVTACAPIIAWKLASLVGMENNAAAVTELNSALQRSVGIALAHGQAVGDKFLADPVNKNNALVKANGYVAEFAGGAALTLGVTGQELATKVAAELALKLHATPSAITVTTAPTAPSAQLDFLKAVGNPAVV